jgi:subtilisin family serine protease
VIGVAAIGKGGDLTSYSNAGIKADIGAPGGDSSEDPTESLILGLTNLGPDRAGAYGYGYGAGTNFSAPHVAGVLALIECAYIQSTDPGWTFEGWAFNVVMPDAGICRPGYKPVRRAYNGLASVNDSNHHYTIDEFEYQRMLQLGWQLEGPVMCAVND